jgi:uroporphyrinogen decarboxylase
MEAVMTNRERFNNLFSGKPVDRVPFLDFMGDCNFNSCLVRWKKEGLDPDAGWEEVRRIIGFDYPRGFFIQPKLLFYPEFEVKLIKREGDKTFIRNKWGGVEIQKDGSEVMSLTVEGPVTDRKTWEEVKDRLSGFTMERMPADFESLCKKAGATDLPVYSGDLPAGFFGALREIFGFEKLMYVYYDDPDLLEEILDTLCDLWIVLYDKIQEHIALDYVFIWEDMCSKNGPLISPAAFREFLLPRYKRLTESVRKTGCGNFMVDSDGDERLLVPLWMEGGVNITLPWETQFGLNMVEVRHSFPSLGIIGGLNKHVLEFSREDMDRELEKVPCLLEKGYYIPSLDHGVTNAVSWDNYCYFYDKLKELVWRYPPQV